MQSDKKKKDDIFNLMHSLFYGVVVQLRQKNELNRSVLMKLNDTNYNFVEFLSNSLKIVRNFCIYDLLYVRCVQTLRDHQNIIQFRLKNYADNFSIVVSSEDLQQNLYKIITGMQEKAREVKWAEYSVRNLIRKILYQSGVANIGNYFTLEDLDTLLFYLKIKLTIDEKNKLIKKTIQNPEQLTQYDFRRVFKVLLLKEELGHIFKELLEIGEYEKIGKLKISLDVLFAWIRENQEESKLDEKEIQDFFEQIRISNIFLYQKEDQSQRYLTDEQKQAFDINFEEFCQFFFSPLNAVFKNQDLENKLDTSHPLSHYYINTSFNSSLKGDSLYGFVSLNQLMIVLERGSRFVQFQIFDGLNGPVIAKDASISEYISVEDCFQTIASLAFQFTKTPLMLHLIFNCSRENRETVADHLDKILGSKIYQLTKDSFKKKQIPNLQELQGKILIFIRTAYPSYMNTKKQNKQESLTWFTTFFSENYNEGGLNTVFGFASLSEGRMREIHTNILSQNGAIEFHQKYLNFAYPELTREDSSNFNPLLGWNLGVQLVGVNQQNKDIFHLYNKAMFYENQKDGYVLKPDILLQNQVFQERENPQIQFDIKVISSQLSCRGIDSSEYIYNYVELRIEGVEKDTLLNAKFCSQVHQNNLFHSIYNSQEKQEVSWRIFHPEQAYLIVMVKNAKNHSILKSNMIKIKLIKEGLRVIPLLENFYLNDHNSYLLVNISIKKIEEQKI